MLNDLFWMGVVIVIVFIIFRTHNYEGYDLAWDLSVYGFLTGMIYFFVALVFSVIVTRVEENTLEVHKYNDYHVCYYETITTNSIWREEDTYSTDYRICWERDLNAEYIDMEEN